MPRRIRLRSSGGDFFSQRGRGITPNMAPPSRRKVPSPRSRTSISPKRILMFLINGFRLRLESQQLLQKDLSFAEQLLKPKRRAGLCFLSYRGACRAGVIQALRSDDGSSDRLHGNKTQVRLWREPETYQFRL